MDLSIYKDLTGRLKKNPERLFKQKKFIAGNSASIDEKAVCALLESGWLEKYPCAVCIDLKKASDLYLSIDSIEEEKINTAFLMARVNFFGTDGVRGKVTARINENPIVDFLNDNAFTAQLVKLISYSFAKMLLDNNIVNSFESGSTGTVVIGNDGRDAANNWVLNNSVSEGFLKAGLNVLDIGVAPTAAVPWMNLKTGNRAGACLTASHNPSNQNGIKFFIDGKKLLPEGVLGDYALSAYIYNYCFMEECQEGDPPGEKSYYSAGDDIVKWMIDNLGCGIKEALNGDMLIFDSANGASDTSGKKALDYLNADYISVNEKCTGDNINRGAGVAEIEGIDYFRGKDYSKHIPTVKKIFDEGRKSKEGSVYGIALDGDGDRGFLLYYIKNNIYEQSSDGDDAVYVLNGDKCGYILAQYLIKSQNLNASEYWFLCTIESDIMTAAAAGSLGLNTKIVSVGDKWIGNFNEKLLVGLEISGHLIFPIEVYNLHEKKQTLLSGVGLLTGLKTIMAIKYSGLSEEKIIKPFEPGFSKTYYTFFVDKNRFYRGSAIWNTDKRIAQEEINKAIAFLSLPEASVINYEDKEDINVLYINIMEGGKILGVLFMRNSGTEDKNAVYVKGQKKYEEVLCEIGKKIQAAHCMEMKNKSRIEYKYEKAVLENLEKNSGKTTVDDVLSALNGIAEADLFSVVYGLKKEGRINVIGREISFG